MVQVYPTQIWGSELPSDVLLDTPQPPVKGERLADGRIRCGCGVTLEDNSSPGLKPSCNFCWSAIDLPPKAQ